jgi:hypothetical protein
MRRTQSMFRRRTLQTGCTTSLCLGQPQSASHRPAPCLRCGRSAVVLRTSENWRVPDTRSGRGPIRRRKLESLGVGWGQTAFLWHLPCCASDPRLRFTDVRHRTGADDDRSLFDHGASTRASDPNWRNPIGCERGCRLLMRRRSLQLAVGARTIGQSRLLPMVASGRFSLRYGRNIGRNERNHRSGYVVSG